MGTENRMQIVAGALKQLVGGATGREVLADLSFDFEPKVIGEVPDLPGEGAHANRSVLGIVLKENIPLGWCSSFRWPSSAGHR